MPQYQTTIQHNLHEFKTYFRPEKCISDGDELVYVFENNFAAARHATIANSLIQQMNLPLTAIHGGGACYFIVKSNEYEL